MDILKTNLKDRKELNALLQKIASYNKTDNIEMFLISQNSVMVKQSTASKSIAKKSSWEESDDHDDSGSGRTQTSITLKLDNEDCANLGIGLTPDIYVPIEFEWIVLQCQIALKYHIMLWMILLWWQKQNL